MIKLQAGATQHAEKLFMATACFLWSISFVATKVAVGHVPPLTVVALRLWMGSGCFLLWFALRRRRITPGGLSWFLQLLLISLFGTGLHLGIQTIGVQYTTASNASLYTMTGPITITLIAAVFLKEALTLRKIYGLLLAVVGVLTVMGWDVLLAFELQENLIGDLLVFASILMWGIFTVLGKNMTGRMPALEVTALITFMGALYMLPVSWLEMRAQGFWLADMGLLDWVAVTFLGVGCSFVAILCYFMSLARTESQKVGIYLYTIPPMTYVIAALLLGETIGLSLISGSLLVLAGVYLTERG